jgi:ubiquinone/menaquinone biosynthesis C-methylase UbiE
MTVLDVGCGMGFFSIGLARIVGDEGCAICADLHQKSLDVLAGRTRRAGVGACIRTHRSEPGQIGVDAPVDFAMACWVLHEVPDRPGFLTQIHSCLKPGGRFLLIEPNIHVSAEMYREELVLARAAGLKLVEEPRIRLSRAALLAKDGATA